MSFLTDAPYVEREHTSRFPPLDRAPPQKIGASQIEAIVARGGEQREALGAQSGRHQAGHRLTFKC